MAKKSPSKSPLKSVTKGHKNAWPKFQGQMRMKAKADGKEFDAKAVAKAWKELNEGDKYTFE